MVHRTVEAYRTVVAWFYRTVVAWLYRTVVVYRTAVAWLCDRVELMYRAKLRRRVSLVGEPSYLDDKANSTELAEY